ncbi:ABC transporter permease [Paenibacillus segetis]|uniref:ABC-2 type transporter transmembrane domain-containing protein n=1 Tax=Paenibacillus segetis TaxID=1325360 RepID=A0ABQ1YGH0_9BACL|nr:ABC transporter permease [Paenibacillus segetis]GGH23487.1 hypothetical protein GCM10008013_22620 [Paenibacillus segetis]
MNVIQLFKNNFNRVLSKKAFIVIVAILPLMIGIAVLFSGESNTKAHIALVSDHAPNMTQNDKLQIKVMNEKPAKSSLLLGKYTAIVEEKSDGSYEITTLKSEEEKEKIESFFDPSKVVESNQSDITKRGVGANILGFILMIILMQGVALITLFPEDRILRTFRRVLTAPVSEGTYLFVQGIFTFICLYIPAYLALVVTKGVFGVDIGYSYGMLAILMVIVCALSTALALFIASTLESNMSLVSSGIYIITSILAGCFYSFTEKNKVLDTIFSIFPQKEYMTLIEGVEKGNGIFEFKGQLTYILIWIVGLWFLGSLITKRKMKKGIY